jgi:LysR family glycine cleavage system transcriptional activator
MSRFPPLKALRVFETAARFQSFKLAGEALSVTPSAVSHQLKSLEEFLGVKLFERRSRQVVLTTEGRAYLTPIRDALEQIRVATEQICCTDAVGAITLSVAPSFATGWLMPRLPEFQLTHPDIEVRLISAIELVDFSQADLDAGIRSGRGAWRGLRSHRLLAEELVPVCNPELARRDGLVSPGDLRETTLLHEIPRLGLWRSWLAAVGIFDVDAERGPKFQGAAMAVDAAVAGLGVAIATRALVETHVREGRLVVPFDIRLPGDSAYYFVYPEERENNAKIVAFKDWILGAVGPGLES